MGRPVHGAEIEVPSQTRPYNLPMSGNTRKFARKVCAWQSSHGRHDLPRQGTTDPYRIWVSEIMLQQTQVGAVVGYFGRFMDRFPDLGSLARASEDEVLQLWSGLGYYARARNLHAAARMVVEVHGGEFPRSAQLIVGLPGVGRSTAAAIAAFAFGERGAILDGNVKRVLARCFGVEGFPGTADVEAGLWSLADSLLPSGRSPAPIEIYTQGLMDLGATVCTRVNPACGACPLSTGCIARKSGRVAELPTPRPRKAYPTRQATWLVLRHRGEILLERRPSSGVWGGLWAFPEYAGKNLARHCHSEFGCELASHRTLPIFAHGFTHFRLEVTTLICNVSRRARRSVTSDTRTWSDIEAATGAAVPTPVRNVLSRL